MSTQTTGTTAIDVTLDASYKFPSLQEAMAAFAAARRVLDEKKALYGSASAHNAEKLRVLEQATVAREEADMQYALAQIARRRVDELAKEQSRANSHKANLFEQLAGHAVSAGEAKGELTELRRRFRLAHAEVLRLTTARDDEIKGICRLAGITEAEINEPNAWGGSLFGTALSRIGARRSDAARTVGIAKAEQQAANEALSAVTDAAVAAGDVFRTRSKQLAATALDESVPFTIDGAELEE